MVRILLFILGVVAAALGLGWFADRPGTIKVEWLGYQIETNAFIGALAVIPAMGYWLWPQHERVVA